MNQQFRRHRYPTAFPLVVRTPLGEFKATVIDVNQGGARLEGLSGVKRGDRVTLQVLHERVAGIVCWTTAHRTGIVFTIPARTGLVDTLRQGSRQSVSGRFSSGRLREMR